MIFGKNFPFGVVAQTEDPPASLACTAVQTLTLLGLKLDWATHLINQAL